MLTLRDLCELRNRWIVSKAKKDNVDEAVSKYDGESQTQHTLWLHWHLLVQLLFQLMNEVIKHVCYDHTAFSTLTLLVECQEEHPACKH